MVGALPSLKAWSGDFGTAYTDRNGITDNALRQRVRAWSKIIAAMQGKLPASVLEVGSNQGLNLRALPSLIDAELWALEPNAHARDVLIKDSVVPSERLMAGFGHEIPMKDASVDMVFTCGVLIHVDPSLRAQTLKEIHRVSAQYIVCIEYFSPREESIRYRDQDDLLFKCDFGGLYLDGFADLELVDYGFFWKRVTGMDDSTWWLFKKTN